MDYTGESTARRSADNLVAFLHMGKAWEVCASREYKKHAQTCPISTQ